MLSWSDDVYTLTAGDVAAGVADSGRCFNWRTRAWQSISTVDSWNCDIGPARLRAVMIRPYLASGGGVRGILFQQYVILSELSAKFRRVRLLGGRDLVGGGTFASWQGDFPLGGGFYWMLARGGLAAGDIVEAHVCYEIPERGEH